MKKPTFLPRLLDGSLGTEPVPYTPLMVIAGSEVHRLAVHHAPHQMALPRTMREWLISEPVTGMKVATVIGSYKGVPCSSRGFTVGHAVAAAHETVNALLERRGSVNFNEVIARAKAKYVEGVAA